MSYHQGYLLAVPAGNREPYRATAREVWPLFEEYGCLCMVETWGVDVPEGKVTSFPMAARFEPGDAVVFSWMEWADRETCDAAMARLLDDPRMNDPGTMSFDGMRMMRGGFERLVDERAGVSE